MATPSSFRCVSDRFVIGRATAWRSMRRVTNALYSNVHTLIKWPTSVEAEKTWKKLEEKYGFPKVIGAIDGTHIRIAAPKQNPEAYINRKGYHSLQLQVICDENLKFLHCYCGQVGSVHDMKIFRLSGFYGMCNDINFPQDSHMFGDAAYEIQKYIMVPFRNNTNLTEPQIKYNTVLSSTRMIVERTLGLLKGRFRSILDKLPMTRTDLIPRYILGCCIMHNICIINNDLINIPIIVNGDKEIDVRAGTFQNLKEEGIVKRNRIVELLNKKI